jgi:DNA-binding Lrp family transcriptional regulator
MRRAERNTTILAAVLEKPRTIPEIVEATGIPRTSVQRRVRRLEELGRVRRNPDETYSPADPIATVSIEASENRRLPRGPPHLGFWDRRELCRQLGRARLQVQAEIHLELLDSKIERRALRLPDPIRRLAELETEVYRRFGLEP